MRVLFIIAAMLLFTTPALAQTTPSPAPAAPVPSATPMGVDGLEITGCSLEYSEQSNVADKVQIDFINHNALPVTKIRFRIQAGLTTFPVMDMGSFKPELHIHHDLNPPAQQVAIIQGSDNADAGKLYCSVDAYTLSDGQTWISDQLQSEMQQKQ